MEDRDPVFLLILVFKPENVIFRNIYKYAPKLMLPVPVDSGIRYAVSIGIRGG